MSAREVFAPALRVMGVSELVLVHNDPSGGPTTSPEDITLTRQLVAAGKVVDIKLHGHVVIGNGVRLLRVARRAGAAVMACRLLFFVEIDTTGARP